MLKVEGQQLHRVTIAVGAGRLESGESMNTVAGKKDKDVLTIGQRFGECISIVIMLYIFSFFAYHQAARTGFFTSKFGPMEMFFLYGPILLSLAAPITRAVLGHRNPARPFEIATNLFLAVGAYWLLVVFPFDFAHLADALPEGVRFLLAWVNNDIGKILFIIQLIVCPIVAIVATWQYFSFRHHASAHAS